MLKKLRIVTLSENTVFANGFHAEWGISVLAETEEGRRRWQRHVQGAVVLNRAQNNTESDGFLRLRPHRETDSSPGTEHAVRLRERLLGSP